MAPCYRRLCELRTVQSAVNTVRLNYSCYSQFNIHYSDALADSVVHGDSFKGRQLTKLKKAFAFFLLAESLKNKTAETFIRN